MARFLNDKQPASGTAPGSLIFIGEQKTDRPRLLLTRYDERRLDETLPDPLPPLSLPLSNDQRTWLALHGLHDTALVGHLGHLLHIDPLALEDALNTGERPKYTEDTLHIHLILKALRFDPDTRTTQIEQITFILGPDHLLTLQETDTPHFQSVRRRLRLAQGNIRRYAHDYLCYALIDSLVDNYLLTIEQIGSIIEQQENRLLSPDPHFIPDTYRYKTELAYIRKNIRPAKEAITRLLTSESPLIAPSTRKYLRDLDSLLLQAVEAVETYYTMLSDQQNSYHANLAKNANDVIRLLTLFSAIFIPLTFLVGVYGMNFPDIPAFSHPHAYPILWAVMILIALLMLLLFKKKKWL